LIPPAAIGSRVGQAYLKKEEFTMKHPLIGLYFTIVVGYWLYLIWEYPVISNMYLLGRAIVWPADFLRWLF